MDFTVSVGPQIWCIPFCTVNAVTWFLSATWRGWSHWQLGYRETGHKAVPAQRLLAGTTYQACLRNLCIRNSRLLFTVHSHGIRHLLCVFTATCKTLGWLQKLWCIPVVAWVTICVDHNRLDPFLPQSQCKQEDEICFYPLMGHMTNPWRVKE